MTKRAALFASSAFALVLALPGHAAADPLWPPVLRDVAPTADTMVGSEAPEFLPNEIVVDLKDDISDADVAALASETHLSLRDNSPDIKDDGKVAIADLDESDIPRAIARLSADPRVESVERV